MERAGRPMRHPGLRWLAGLVALVLRLGLGSGSKSARFIEVGLYSYSSASTTSSTENPTLMFLARLVADDQALGWCR